MAIYTINTIRDLNLKGLFICSFRTYNYGLSSYKLGNDFLGLTIQSSQVLKNAETHNWSIFKDQETAAQYLEAPGGYRFYIIDAEQPKDSGIYYL